MYGTAFAKFIAQNIITVEARNSVLVGFSIINIPQQVVRLRG